MNKISLLLAIALLLAPMVLAGCGSSSSSSGSSYYTMPYYGADYPVAQNQDPYYPQYDYDDDNDNDEHYNGDSTNPSVTVTSPVILDSGNYDEAVFSVVGKGFGRNFGNVEMFRVSGSGSLSYYIRSWADDAINIGVLGLSQASEGVYSLTITTAGGASVAAPEVRVTPNGIDDNRNGRMFAIFAATSQSSIATYCQKDAQTMYDALVGGGGFSSWTASLLNNGQTTNDLKSELESAVASVSENDTFLFYYSGHGNVNYLAMDYNNGGITCSEIESYLRRMPAKTHKILIIDACSSGSFLPKDLESRAAGNFREIGSSIQNVAVMSACGPENDSGVSTGIGQSEFTYALVQGIGYLGTPITVNQLYNYVVGLDDFYTEQDYGVAFPVFKKIGNDLYIH